MQRGTLLPDRLAGAIWGHLVGDAVGVPYEFRPASAIGEVRFGATGTHRQPPGTWSDDGGLMLALLDSLLSAGFDVEDQGRRALAWADDGAYTPDGDGRFDIGNATRTALDRIRRGQPAATSGGTGESDLGNGSLMRVLPVALVDADVDDAELVERAHAASAVTHGHPVAQAACAWYVLVARGLLTGHGERQQALDRARRTLRQLYGASADRKAALDRLEAWEGRSGRGFVVDSFWSAWDAFAGADSYKETIVRAIRYGNDTDTTAAIAGGLAGIRWGIDGIPRPWREDLRGRDLVDPLVDRLVERHGWSTSSTNPIRVAWVVELDPRQEEGTVGITFLPGKRDPMGRSARHWRSVRTDLTDLARAGVDLLVVLVEDRELLTLGVSASDLETREARPHIIRFPIPDFGIPADHEAFARDCLGSVTGAMKFGGNAVLACRGGLGRAGLVAACVLVDWGWEPASAIDQVRTVRPGAIETREQEAFVERHGVFRRGGRAA